MRERRGYLSAALPSSYNKYAPSRTRPTARIVCESRISQRSKGAVMRITLDLRSFDDFDEAAFASLWLDTEMHRWSRESHEQLDLPKWGVVNLSPGETHLCGQTENDRIPLVRLEGLDLDYETTRAEHSNFADDDS
jgi:uncharacterized protein DUF3564